ncbi:hypothetical protein [Aureibaculum luteum]|uniref:hypothetical protein n=1 Tax=Aureibaculum luteum TaxID=1548456 RepID=UPI000E54AE18|nr:hypothetical protein [Aureibaculum luteum]
MKNTLLVLLLLTAIVNAQNKVVIKNTFFNQNIDEFDALAIKNGVKAGDDVFMWVNFKSDVEGSVYGLELDERSKIFEPAITAIISKIPTLDANNI